ncbi:pyridoxamine 5'-phosphate oxidase family protein [Paenibacillus larvae]
MNKSMTELNEQLTQHLQKENVVFLHTLDHESGAPTSNAISWVHAMSPTLVRFALDERSRLIDNIKKQDQVTLTVIAGGTVYAIYGKAKMVSESLEDVPFKLAAVDLHVEMVRNVMYYGGRISVEPEYEKTYDKRAAEKLDGQVFSAIKKA